MKQKSLLLACLGISLIAGCSHKSKTPFADVPGGVSEIIVDAELAPLNPAPESQPVETVKPMTITVDEQGNMTRHFGTSTLPEQGGEIIAGPVYWPNLNRSQKRSNLENFVFEPFEFVYQTVTLPVRAAITPPWKRVINTPVPTEDAVPASTYRRQIISTERMEN